MKWNTLKRQDMRLNRHLDDIHRIKKVKELHLFSWGSEYRNTRMSGAVSEFQRQFGSLRKVRDHFAKLRWGDTGWTCPKCASYGEKHFFKHKKDREQGTKRNKATWRCNSCRIHYSYTSGTAFHRSRITLPQIYIAAFVLVNHKHATQPIMRIATGIASNTTANNLIWLLTRIIDSEKGRRERLLKISEKLQDDLQAPIRAMTRLLKYAVEAPPLKKQKPRVK